MINIKGKKFIKKELNIGKKVELEHSKSQKVATKIAKQHLAEFPDYYTNLVKMEKRLKKKRNNQLITAGYLFKRPTKRRAK